MKELCDGLRVWNGVFKFLHTLCHVGVGVGHTAQTYVLHSRIVGEFDFLDDVFRRPPNWNTFFWFNAELTTTFVAHTSLVDFNFVGKWARPFRSR